MAGVSVEFILMVGYALALALIVFLLGLAAGRARRRSMGLSTAGFTYDPGQDICPQDQHLFPVFSDSAKGITIYRAPADACNSCMSKAACTDSSGECEIERNSLTDVDSGMVSFHRVLSMTLLALAGVLLAVELFRAGNLYPRVLLASTLLLFCTFIVRLSAKLSESGQHSAASSSVSC